MHSRALQLRNNNFYSHNDSESVSIIVPCFNESEGIKGLKTKLLPVMEKLRLTRSVELIIVDDGSTDDTFVKLQLFDGQAQIVRHKSNRGISAATRTGVMYSTGKIICTIDSDCTYDPQELINLLDLMRGDVGIVTGSPYHPQGSVSNVPTWRLFLSKSLSQIYRLVLPQKLYTYTSMFRAYRREVFETIPPMSPGFLGLVEIIVEAIWQGYKVVEFPTQLSRRVYGQSKLRVAKVIWSHLTYITKLIRCRLQKRTTYK